MASHSGPELHNLPARLYDVDDLFPRVSSSSIAGPVRNITQYKEVLPGTPIAPVAPVASLVRVKSIASDKCRYCFGGVTAREPLISPCECRGSLKYVHRACLERWLNTKHIQHCDICRFHYDIKWKYKSVRQWKLPSFNGEDVVCFILVVAVDITLLNTIIAIAQLVSVRQMLPSGVFNVAMAALGMGLIWFLVGSIIITSIICTSECWEDWKFCNQRQTVVLSAGTAQITIDQVNKAEEGTLNMDDEIL